MLCTLFMTLTCNNLRARLYSMGSDHTIQLHVFRNLSVTLRRLAGRDGGTCTGSASSGAAEAEAAEQVAMSALLQQAVHTSAASASSLPGRPEQHSDICSSASREAQLARAVELTARARLIERSFGAAVRASQLAAQQQLAAAMRARKDVSERIEAVQQQRQQLFKLTLGTAAAAPGVLAEPWWAAAIDHVCGGGGGGGEALALARRLESWRQTANADRAAGVPHVIGSHDSRWGLARQSRATLHLLCLDGAPLQCLTCIYHPTVPSLLCNSLCRRLRTPPAARGAGCAHFVCGSVPHCNG